MNLEACQTVRQFFAAFTALNLVYPWRIFYGEFDFGWTTTLASYVILASIMASLGVLVAPRVLDKLSPDRVHSGTRSIFVAIACFFLLVVLAVLFSGPGMALNIPGTQIRGIFFTEWNFVIFLLEIGVPFSVLVAVVDRWKRR